MDLIPKELLDLREQIDSLDNQLLEVLKKRFEITDQVGIIKKQYQLPVEDLVREEKQFNHLAQKSKLLKLNSDLLQNIFKIILDEVKQRHRQV